MELFRLLGTIAIQNEEANDAIDETTDKASKSEGKMSSAFKKIGSCVVAAFAVEKVVQFGKACVEAAASVKAANSQFEQTFGELETQATDAINRVAESSNILDARLKGVGTSIYAFAKTTGMESADALGLMERALQVTADSAAYYDRSLEDVSESLKSFLKGNFENDAALGLSCTETTRNAAANELYGKSFKDLSEAQKQLTLLKMVEDANELSGAMGQAAREGSGWENVTGNLKESWNQFLAVIGTPILNALVPIVQGITNCITFFTGAIQNASGIVGTHFPEIAQFFSEASAGMVDTWNNHLKPVFDAIVYWLETQIMPAFEFVFKTIIEPLVTTVFDTISRIWNGTLKPVFDGICDFLAGTFTGDWKRAFQGILNIVTGIFNAICVAVETPMNLIKNIVNSAINYIKEKFNFKWELPKLKMPHFKISGSFSLNPPSVPSFGIEWYKKAMDDPMIMDTPTAFGINAKGQIMAGGEAGSEVVSGTETLMNMIASAVAAQNEALVNVLLDILDAILALQDIDISAILKIVPDDRGIFKIVERQARIRKNATGKAVFE